MKPMLADTFDPESEIHQLALRTWPCELKARGVRAIVTRGQVTTRVVSKKTEELTDKTEHLPWVKDFPPGIMLDGELIWGSTEREAMSVLGCLPEKSRELQKDNPVILVAFDLLMFDGRNFQMNKQTVRSLMLTKLMPTLADFPIKLITRKPDRVKSQVWYEDVVKAGYEGVILKYPYGVYSPGLRPSNVWIKLKPDRTFNVVILRVQPGKEGKTGQMLGLMGALELGMWDGSSLVPVGKVGTGFSLEQRAEKWRPREVIEVKCAEVTPDGKLSHTRFERRRPDLTYKEASLEQYQS